MSFLGNVLALALAYLTFLALLLRLDAVKSRRRATQSEARYLQLSEEVPLACQEIDVTGVIRRVNKELCDLRDLDAESIIGKHYADLAPESDRDRIRAESGFKLKGDV